MEPANTQPLVIYVDVDDTLVRSYGASRIPIPAAIRHVRALHEQGALLYCWSSGGAAYARSSAEESGSSECFAAFLPKPHVVIDDQAIGEWRWFAHIHPNACAAHTFGSYSELLAGGRPAGGADDAASPAERIAALEPRLFELYRGGDWLGTVTLSAAESNFPWFVGYLEPAPVFAAILPLIEGGAWEELLRPGLRMHCLATGDWDDLIALRIEGRRVAWR